MMAYKGYIISKKKESQGDTMQIHSKVTSVYLLVFKSKLVLLYELFGQSLNNDAGF